MDDEQLSVRTPSVIRRAHARLRATTLAVVCAMAMCFASAPAHATTSQGDNEESIIIRVDQVGYTPAETKRAFVLSHTDITGEEYTVTASDGTVASSAALGTSRGAWNDTYPFVYAVDFTDVAQKGDYKISIDEAQSSVFAVDAENKLFPDAVTTIATFFQSQRDGSDVVAGALDRKASHLNDAKATVYEYDPTLYDDDGLLQKLPDPVAGIDPVDVSGGWFDAGDYLKFVTTTSYAAALMLVAQRELPAPDSTLDAELDHGLEWLDKMWNDEDGVLYVQVGIGDGSEELNVTGDHDTWRLPQADDALSVARDASPGTPNTSDYFLAYRPVFAGNSPGEKISPNLAGRLSAVFALAAQRAAEKDDGVKAAKWFAKAERVYALADTTWKQQLVTTVPFDYYPEETWLDDMTLGAAELAMAALALDDDSAEAYLEDATGFAARNDTADLLNLYNVTPLADAELIAALREHGDADRGAKEDDLLSSIRSSGLDPARVNAHDDVFGSVASPSEWDVASKSFGAMATALLYSRLTGDDAYSDVATNARNWSFGRNAWGLSWIVGIGDAYPRCLQHQLSNLHGDGLTPPRGAVVNGPNGFTTSDPDEMGDWGNFFDNANRCPASASSTMPDAYAAFQSPEAYNDTRFLDWVSNWATSEPAIDFTASALLALALQSSSTSSHVAETPATSDTLPFWVWLVVGGTLAIALLIAALVFAAARRRSKRIRGYREPAA